MHLQVQQLLMRTGQHNQQLLDTVAMVPLQCSATFQQEVAVVAVVVPVQESALQTLD